MKEPWEEDWLPKFIGRRAAHPRRKRSVTAAGGKQQKLWDESCTACPEVSGEIGQAAGRTEDFQKGTLEKLPGKGKSFSRRAEGVWRKPVYEIDRLHRTDSHLFIIWEKEGLDHRNSNVFRRFVHTGSNQWNKWANYIIDDRGASIRTLPFCEWCDWTLPIFHFVNSL